VTYYAGVLYLDITRAAAPGDRDGCLSTEFVRKLGGKAGL